MENFKVICEFDLPVPERRSKTRVVEDEKGYWRIQSLVHSREEDEKSDVVWKDEFRLNSEWPAEYPTFVINLSSVLKAVAKGLSDKPTGSSAEGCIPEQPEPDR